MLFCVFRLFITPVSKNITADHLREIFGHFGTVTNVILPSLRGVLNLTGSPLNTGTAFVTLATRKEAESALEAMHEGWLDGHSIRVSFADPKADGREDRGRYRVDDKRRDARSRSRGRAPHYERNGDDRKDYIRDDRRIGRDDRRSFDYRAPDRRRDGYDDRRGGNRYDERRGVREHRSRSRSVGRDRRYR
ncbi:hypothetical protein DFJ77DRAFT_445590 [Powellomyces hirtus]|nr:hypothetical protein DFJ77DRAFT_445590 [Powellomyces hirtus]